MILYTIPVLIFIGEYMKYRKGAFTLVELVVAVTIIAILAATGFVAYTGYIDTGRDANRIVQLSDLRDGMQVYAVQNRLPIPAGSVNIQANTETFAYQGNLNQNIVELIGYNSGGGDPEYDTYPVYMLSSNKKDFQLMTFLSESDSQLSLLPEAQAVVPDYEILFPYSIGAPLGILLDTATQQPVHEFSDIITAGSYDIVTGTHALSAYISNDEQLNSSESLISMIPNQSCRRILEMGKSSGSKVYSISPDGTGNIRVYCDMETDGGGWTLIDNKLEDESISGRSLNTTITLNKTQGSLLPSYSWSKQPKLMVKSNYYDGDEEFVIFNVLSDEAKEYPTSDNPIPGIGQTNHFSIDRLNGNTDRGTGAWIYNGSGRIGTVWIGSGSLPTAACGYVGFNSGLGMFNGTASCSTWVR